MNNTILTYILRKKCVLNPNGGYGAWNLWYAADMERCSCCDRYTPTYEDPYRLIRHCRSLHHVCTLHSTDYNTACDIVKQLHWCAIEKLAQKVRLYTDIQTTPITVEALAPAFLQALYNHRKLLNPDEMNALVLFLEDYLMDADTPSYAAIRAFIALRQ